MTVDQHFSITLPEDIADVIQQKVRSGDYASVSEVVRDGVRALVDQDTAVEQWLRHEVVTGHAEYVADPSKAVSAEEVLHRIRARRNAAPRE